MNCPTCGATSPLDDLTSLIGLTLPPSITGGAPEPLTAPCPDPWHTNPSVLDEAVRAADEAVRAAADGLPDVDPTATTEQSAAAMLAGVLLNVGENLAPLYEAVDQYRRHAMGNGWGGDAASQIAADYHRYVITVLLHTQTGQAGPAPSEPEAPHD